MDSRGPLSCNRAWSKLLVCENNRTNLELSIEQFEIKNAFVYEIDMNCTEYNISTTLSNRIKHFAIINDAPLWL